MDTNQNSVSGENVYVYTPEQCLLEEMFMYTNQNSVYWRKCLCIQT